MFETLERESKAPNPEEARQLLQELEGNTPDEIRKKRAHFRVMIKAAVILQSGNSSELLNFKAKAMTGDVSEGGCSVLAPMPLKVGDIYRLTFDRQRLDLPMMFARCLRCRLIREDAYEAGFSFFLPITLPEGLTTQVGHA